METVLKTEWQESGSLRVRVTVQAVEPSPLRAHWFRLRLIGRDHDEVPAPPATKGQDRAQGW